MTRRLFKKIFLASFFPVLAAWSAQIPARPDISSPLPSVVEFDDLAIPMRDGVPLSADLYLPAGTGRWPTILVRTPYNRRSTTTRGYRIFAEHSYAVLTEDVRGRYGSGGSFGSIAQEGPDGNDTINWIAAQPWSNGRVGMAGASYVGIVQWWAAVQHNPHLLAIFPLVSGDDEYLDRYYSPGGALKLGHRLVWVSENLKPSGTRSPAFSSYIRHLPLKTADLAAAAQKVDMWRFPLSHPSYDRFWTALSIRSRLPDVTAAVSSVGGWFDNYVESDLDAFARLAGAGRPVETWIGPWSHTLARRYPAIDFGPLATPHIRSLQLAWFDRFLKVSGKAGDSLPALHIFVMGENVWREEHEWPLARTRYTPLYLTSLGNANTSAGDGKLASHFKEHDASDHFVYDPQRPVPTTGGAVCCNPSLLPPGPLDQALVERRNDVLVYTSLPLRSALEVTGPVGVTLYVATSRNDTDFTAKLVDVFPNGTPLLVTDGIARLRYRLSLAKPSFVKASLPYQVHIDAGVTSWLFQEGHRIRLEVSSSNFPRFDRNLNSVRPNAEEIKTAIANQTVLHDARYPSAVILPVIPRLRSTTSALDSHSQVKSSTMGDH